MAKSMTGFGRCVAEADGRQLTVELKSVNNRYLDCNVRLPRGFLYAEEAVKAAIADYYDRKGIAHDLHPHCDGCCDACAKEH